MSEYIPPEFPEITAHFFFSPGEPQTHWLPGTPHEVEFTDIEINGQKIGPDLEQDLLERHGDEWEREIVKIHEAYKNRRLRA